MWKPIEFKISYCWGRSRLEHTGKIRWEGNWWKATKLHQHLKVCKWLVSQKLSGLRVWFPLVQNASQRVFAVYTSLARDVNRNSLTWHVSTLPLAKGHISWSLCKFCIWLLHERKIFRIRIFAECLSKFPLHAGYAWIGLACQDIPSDARCASWSKPTCKQRFSSQAFHEAQQVRDACVARLNHPPLDIPSKSFRKITSLAISANPDKYHMFWAAVRHLTGCRGNCSIASSAECN